MSTQQINGITFNMAEVSSRNDSLFWHYHLTKTDLEYATNNYGIYPYEDNLEVLIEGLNMTVRAGMAVAYGRNVEVKLPTILSVGVGEIGKLVINIDLNQANLSQVSLMTTQDELIQQDLSRGGLQFQIPLGDYDSTSGSIVFTPSTIMLKDSFMITNLKPVRSVCRIEETFDDVEFYGINTVAELLDTIITKTTNVLGTSGKLYNLNDFVDYTCSDPSYINFFEIINTKLVGVGSGNESTFIWEKRDLETLTARSKITVFYPYANATYTYVVNGGQPQFAAVPETVYIKRLHAGGMTLEGSSVNIINGNSTNTSGTEPWELLDLKYSTGENMAQIGKTDSTDGTGSVYLRQYAKSTGEITAALSFGFNTTNKVVHSVAGVAHKLAYMSDISARSLSALELAEQQAEINLLLAPNEEILEKQKAVNKQLDNEIIEVLTMVIDEKSEQLKQTIEARIKTDKVKKTRKKEKTKKDEEFAKKEIKEITELLESTQSDLEQEIDYLVSKLEKRGIKYDRKIKE